MLPDGGVVIERQYARGQWGDTTLRADDPDPTGRALFDKVMRSGERMSAIDYPVFPPEPLTRLQFVRVMRRHGAISQAEAEAYLSTSDIPGIILSVIDDLPEEARDEVRLEVKGATLYAVGHPVIAAAAIKLGWTPQKLEAVFREGEAI